MVYRILCIVFLAWIQLGAENPEQLLRSGNEAYRKGDYGQAISKYQAILAQGFRSGEVYYNLGNCYFRQQHLGLARLQYERAHRFLPDDDEVRHNLTEVQSRLKDQIEPVSGFFLLRWWVVLRGLATSGVWSLLALLLFWVGMTGMIIWLRADERKLKKWAFVTGIISLALFVIPLSLAYSAAHFEKDSQEAVILASEISLRSAPDDLSSAILPLHEGSKLDILDQIGQWYKVRLVNGEQGWLPVSALEKI